MFVIVGDPLGLAAMLEALVHYPDDQSLKFCAGNQAASVTGTSFNPSFLTSFSERDRARAIDIALRIQLEQLLDGDFPDKDLVRAVLATLEDRQSE